MTLVSFSLLVVFFFLVVVVAFKTFSFRLLSAYLSDSENEEPLGFFRRMFQNATYFTSFCVAEKYPLLLKINRYKDGCYLKYSFGVSRSVCLSFSLCLYLIFNCVCVV